MSIVIITDLDELPDHCVDCPFMNDAYSKCQADPENRCSTWRPFWCPLKVAVVELEG